MDFVAQNSLKYSLSSDKLEDLGGSEKKRVRTEYYPNDYEWSARGPIRLKQVRALAAMVPAPQHICMCYTMQGALFTWRWLSVLDSESTRMRFR